MARLPFAALAALFSLLSSANPRVVRAQERHTSSADEIHASARNLAAHLVAPCCWTESLDVHDSPLALELRLEIEQRLARGEPSSAIEADLVGRHGERIRAIPTGIDSLASVLVLLLGLVGLALALARRRPTAAPGPTPSSPPVHTPLDTALDRELAALDDGDVV